MADFIYRSVTTTKHTKGETFHVFMRETNVSLERQTGLEPAITVLDGLYPHSECGKVANSLTAAYQRFVYFLSQLMY